MATDSFEHLTGTLVKLQYNHSCFAGEAQLQLQMIQAQTADTQPILSSLVSCSHFHPQQRRDMPLGAQPKAVVGANIILHLHVGLL